MSKKQLVNYFFGLEPEQIPSRIIFTPFFPLKYFKEHLGTESKSFSGRTEIKGLLGKYKGHSLAVIKTGIGASLIGDLVLSLKGLTVKIVLGGSAGALTSDLSIGDYFITTEAYNGEGFSQYHLNNIEQILAKSDKVLIRKSLKEHLTKLHIKKGSTYTIGSLLAENETFLELLKNYQIETIDMETSALYTAARAARIDAVTMNFISDLPQSKPFYEKHTKEDQLRLNYATEGFPKALLDLVISI